jgi:TolA protein
MRASLFISIVVHLLLLSAAVLNFSSDATLKPAQPVTVEILSPSEFSQLKAGKPENKPEAAAPKSAPQEKLPEIVQTSAELRAPEKPSRTQAALPPPKPKAAPPAEPKASAQKAPSPPESAKSVVEKPETKPQTVAAPEKRTERRAEVPKQPEQRAQSQPNRDKQPESKPAARAGQDRIADLIDKPTPNKTGKAEFDPKQIAALLNRDPNAGARPHQEAPREPWRKPSSLQEQASGAEAEAPRRDIYGAPEGRDARMSASDIDALRAQISRCWAPPVGGLGSDAIIVKLRIVLNEDGTLSRAPEVVNGHASPFFPPAADSAVRAVFQCQPYRMPPAKYGEWRDMLLNFDPSRMYGG